MQILLEPRAQTGSNEGRSHIFAEGDANMNCKHEFEFVESSCGCETEVCYNCTWNVVVSQCDHCRREDSEE